MSNKLTAMDALEAPHIATRAARGAFLRHSAAPAPRRARPRLEVAMWRGKNYTHFHREHKLAVDIFFCTHYKTIRATRTPAAIAVEPAGHVPGNRGDPERAPLSHAERHHP